MHGGNNLSRASSPADEMRYFRDAYAASRCCDDRSTPPPRKDHVVLRRMASGLRNDGRSRRAVRGRVAERKYFRFGNLIIIDDLMAETDERVTTMFTKKRCRTWLGRCIRETLSSSKRLLKTPRRYRTVFYWSISNRTRPMGKRRRKTIFPDDGVQYVYLPKIYKDRVRGSSRFIRTMSDLVKRDILCI